MKTRVWVTLALAGVAGLQTASAGLILETFEEFSGTGKGAVPTILTFQNTGSESGCISPTGTGSLLSGGLCTGSAADVKGGGQTQTQTLGSVGITRASDFALVFNAVEPSGDPITVNNVIAAFYDPSGTLLYQTSGFFCQTSAGGPITPVAGGCLLNSTAQGTGNSGFLITLTSDQAQAATGLGVFTSSTIVGVSSTASGAAGGPETIFLANLGAGSPSPEPVPEPATFVLIGCGLIGIAAIRLRKNA